MQLCFYFTDPTPAPTDDPTPAPIDIPVCDAENIATAVVVSSGCDTDDATCDDLDDYLEQLLAG